LNETPIDGLLQLMMIAILGKVVFYFLIELVDRGIKYFTGESKEHKMITKDILGELKENQAFVKQVTKIINDTDRFTTKTAKEIVNLRAVSAAINKRVKEESDRKKIKEQIEKIFYNTWNDSNVLSRISTNIKKDIK